MVIVQSSYSVIIVLDSVIVNRNNGNIAIIGTNVPNYNLTINNSRISDTNGFGLVVRQLNGLTHNCIANASTNSIASISIANSVIHVSATVSDGNVPEGDVGAINKSDTSTLLECSVQLMTTVDCQTVS